MTKEALKLALEALESKFLFIAGDGEAVDQRAKAITSIKEALMSVPDGTQPDLNLNCKSVQARLATAWGYVKAQPEQEPVAWEIFALKFGNGTRLSYVKPENLPSYLGCRPLYTTPPPVAEPHKRPSQSDIKPLTDDELQLIANKFRANTNTGHSFYGIARAIEAAHGIKGEA